jgi:tetratricopeptide (TPR) repeat protein
VEQSAEALSRLVHVDLAAGLRTAIDDTASRDRSPRSSREGPYGVGGMLESNSQDRGADLAAEGAYLDVAQRVLDLIEGGDGRAAVALADKCTGPPVLVHQLRASTYTEAAPGLRDRELASRAIELWQAVGIDAPRLKYHEANAHLALWDLEVHERGLADALTSCRHHLHAGRDLYAEVPCGADAEEDVAVQALTNLGNSLDHMGRSVDAIERYDQALAIDPRFGMALGNKGLAVLGVASLVSDHRPTILNQAAWFFERALEDEERVLQVGGPPALAHFRETRQRMGGEPARSPDKEVPWSDPHLEWCRRNELFLHPSLSCLREDSEFLDPLYFSGITVGVSEEERRRMNYIIDAFNAIKQDYLAARYLAWITTAPDTPISEQTSRLRARARMYDSLNYARWGVRTGMALQALTAAINMLDKVASFVHLYLGIQRKPKVYFRTLWHPPARRGTPAVMHTEIANRLARDPRLNAGLLALCDLSGDLERPTPLNELVERRHAATHRFLVAHHMLLEGENDDWAERVSWDELSAGIVSQLRTARAAMIYLARTIDIEEEHRHRLLADKPGVVPQLPMWAVVDEHAELD